jgi:hypothetical protein
VREDFDGDNDEEQHGVEEGGRDEVGLRDHGGDCRPGWQCPIGRSPHGDERFTNTANTHQIACLVSRRRASRSTAPYLMRSSRNMPCAGKELPCTRRHKGQRRGIGAGKHHRASTLPSPDQG